MEQTLPALKVKRGHFKTALTNFKKYVEKLNLNEITDVVITQLESRLSKIEPVLDEFNNVHLEIKTINCSNVSSDDNNLDDSELESFEDTYFQYTAKAKSIILESRSNTTKDQNLVGVAQNHSNSNQIRLPTINLPTFSSHYEHWQEFSDTFKSLVHDNHAITAIQKFYYLKSCLKNEAAQTIQNIEVSASNYQVAWDLLRERFENKRLIVNSYIRSIVEFPPIGKHIQLRQLFDTVTKNVRCLKNIGQPVETWDSLLIYIIVSKFDASLRKDWESARSPTILPTMNELNEFLKSKCQILDTLKTTHAENYINQRSKFGHQSSNLLATNQPTCNFCKHSHSIFHCEQFLKLSINERIKEMQNRQLCLNCLRINHLTRECRSKICCKKCNKKHHTLLHIEAIKPNPTSNEHVQTSTVSNQETENIQASAPITANHIAFNPSTSQVLLSTVRVNVEDNRGQLHECRALLDSGAMSNFISEDMCNQLQLKRSKINVSVTGISQSNFKISHAVNLTIFAKHGNYKVLLACLVLEKITEPLPTNSFDASLLQIPANITLADHSFNIPDKIDLLIGSSNFYNLLCVGQLQLGKGLPTLQKTRLGWIIAGPLNYSQLVNHSTQNYLSISNDSLHAELERFWSLEECNNTLPKLSPEEQQCEDYFKQTTTRDPKTKQFVVKVPFKETIQSLGDSYDIALRRLYSLERRFRRNPHLKEQYLEFLKEYENLNHMRLLTKTDLEGNKSGCYLPHHPVLRDSSLTTQVRVVFDGSAKTSTGISLNDAQMTGPTIQNDLFSILIRFRKQPIVISADITKMYRQILISDTDRAYQRILFRNNENEPIKHFELNTVTYGTKSAPFLAIRCLHQLSIDFKDKHPQTSNIIKNDFYVDDLLTGGNDVEQIKQIYCELTSILNSCGFELRKWKTNNAEVLNFIKNKTQSTSQVLPICENSQTKTLGICWNSATDVFQYETKLNHTTNDVTKRTILSITSQIFDPLGLLTPFTMVSKLIIQDLWQQNINWDESIPLELHTRWINFRNNFPQLKNVSINRHVICKNPIKIELHGFADSSEKGYGAAIYIKSLDNFSNCIIRLLCAKSRVAPLRKVTLPRLELCAAVLLANLVNKVKLEININFSKFVYWSDSTITLNWINSPPNRWNTFICNRVAEIQSYTNPSDWRHVPSQDNPADLISRGTTVQELINSSLWWQGPGWLANESEWPLQTFHTQSENPLPELRKTVCLSNTMKEFDLISKFSNLHKLKKVFAWCLRFINNTRRKEILTGPISAKELNNSLLVLTKIAQGQSYSVELNDLKRHGKINSKSRLLSLNPFLDEINLLRVGGRLNNANLQRDKKFPIILPSDHKLTLLIIKNEHEKLLHGGTQMVLSSLRERFWPTSGTNTVKRVLRNCIRCFRANPTNYEYIMAALPKNRVEPNYPFFNVGIDYAGPFMIKNKKGRGARLTKAYICLFICFSTKAIHLELVSDLTTAGFIATLRRFTSRRGKPQNIYSDNGSNFVGANTEIKQLYKMLESESELIRNDLITDNITWQFIPPKGPHWGGLWERGIRSTKQHLKRVLGNAHVTYEEFHTILTQIESILNSRPLYPLSNDHNDLNPLTPAHFLIGRSLLAVPDPNLLDIPVGRLSRFQRMQQLIQQFWKTWSREYLSTLQSRPKWRQNNQPVINTGDMVLVREDNLPPLRWQLGRIENMHPGKDGIVRVVTIKTQTGILKRPVTKVCFLPCAEK